MESQTKTECPQIQPRKQSLTQKLSEFLHLDNNEADNTFDSNKLKFFFQKCQENKGDILIADFIAGYSQVYLLVQQMGTILSFVSKLMHNWMDILEKLKANKDYGSHYNSVRTMFEYEKKTRKNDLLSPHTGTGAFLRLYKLLKFNASFVGEVGKAKDEDNLGPIAKKIYDNHLAKHDNWLSRKTAHFAFYMMPNKKTTYDAITKEDKKRRAVMEENTPQCVENMTSTVELAAKIFTEFNIAVKYL